MRLLSIPSLLLLLSPLTSSLPMADDASLDSQLANPDSYPGLDTRKKPKQVTFPGGKCYSDRKNIVAASYFSSIVGPGCKETLSQQPIPAGNGFRVQIGALEAVERGGVYFHNGKGTPWKVAEAECNDLLNRIIANCFTLGNDRLGPGGWVWAAGQKKGDSRWVEIVSPETLFTLGVILN